MENGHRLNSLAEEHGQKKAHQDSVRGVTIDADASIEHNYIKNVLCQCAIFSEPPRRAGILLRLFEVRSVRTFRRLLKQNALVPVDVAGDPTLTVDAQEMAAPFVQVKDVLLRVVVAQRVQGAQRQAASVQIHPQFFFPSKMGRPTKPLL